jgi:hypothetical protein
MKAQTWIARQLTRIPHGSQAKGDRGMESDGKDLHRYMKRRIFLCRKDALGRDLRH